MAISSTLAAEVAALRRRLADLSIGEAFLDALVSSPPSLLEPQAAVLREAVSLWKAENGPAERTRIAQDIELLAECL